MNGDLGTRGAVTSGERPMVRIGAGTVAHHVGADGVPLCKRTGETSRAMAGMRVCKPCAVVHERAAREVSEDAPRTRSVAEIRDYVSQRTADTRRIRERALLDVRSDGGRTLAVSAGTGRVSDTPIVTVEATLTRRTTTAMADRASMVAPLAAGVYTVGAFGRPAQVSPMLGDTDAPDVTATYAREAWEYVCANTFSTRFSATMLYRLTREARDGGWTPIPSDREDAEQHARLRAVEALSEWLTGEDVTAHTECACASCAGRDVPPLNGIVAFSRPRLRRCGTCPGCEGTTGSKWLTAGCEAPVEDVDHVNITGIVNRAVYRAATLYVRARLTKSSAEPVADDVLSGAMPTRVSPDALEGVPSDVASIVSTVCSALTLTGDDVTDSQGRLTVASGNALGILTGHISRDADGTYRDATKMQRSATLSALRAMLGRPLAEDENGECECRYATRGKSLVDLARTGTRARVLSRCTGHGGMPAARWWAADAARVWAIDGGDVLMREVRADGGRGAVDTIRPDDATERAEDAPVIVRVMTDEDRARVVSRVRVDVSREGLPRSLRVADLLPASRVMLAR